MPEGLSAVWSAVRPVLAFIGHWHLPEALAALGAILTAWATAASQPRRKGTPQEEAKRYAEALELEMAARKTAFARHGLAEGSWVRGSVEGQLQFARGDDTLRVQLLRALRGRAPAAVRALRTMARNAERSKSLPPDERPVYRRELLATAGAVAFLTDEGQALALYAMAGEGTDALSVLHPLSHLLLRAGRAAEAADVAARAMTAHEANRIRIAAGFGQSGDREELTRRLDGNSAGAMQAVNRREAARRAAWSAGANPPSATAPAGSP